MTLAELLRRIDIDDPAAAIHEIMAEAGVCRFGDGRFIGLSCPEHDISGFGLSSRDAAEAFVRAGYNALEESMLTGARSGPIIRIGRDQ